MCRPKNPDSRLNPKSRMIPERPENTQFTSKAVRRRSASLRWVFMVCLPRCWFNSYKGYFAWVKVQGRSLTVGAEGLHHSIHITKETRNVGRIQDRPVGETGRANTLDILGSNVAGVPRHLFCKG